MAEATQESHTCADSPKEDPQEREPLEVHATSGGDQGCIEDRKPRCGRPWHHQGNPLRRRVLEPAGKGPGHALLMQPMEDMRIPWAKRADREDDTVNQASGGPRQLPYSVGN